MQQCVDRGRRQSWAQPAAQLRHPGTGHVVRGFVDERAPVRGDVHGRVSDLARVIRTQFVDEIVITSPYDSDLVRKVAREARRNRISVAVVPELFGFAPQSVSFGSVGRYAGPQTV